jgi:nicotinamidase-related amidase
MPTSRALFLAIACGVLLTPALPSMVAAQAVTDDWASAKVPVEAPPLKPVTIDPKTTALAVMDFNMMGCSMARRPRCVADLPNVAKVLAAARQHGMFVFHTLAGPTTVADIPPTIVPRTGEPVYSGAGPDKFIGGSSDLLAVLKGKGITTLLVTGTSSNGAVLYTASGASMRHFKVVVPVDCMPGDTAFTEAFPVWELAHAPVISNNVTLTKSDLLSFGP